MFFLQAALKITLLLGLAWVALLFMRGKSAALRHQVWCVALAAVLILPLLAAVLPPLHVPVANSLLANELLFRSEARSAAQPPMPHQPITALAESQPWLANGGMLLAFLWALGTAVSLGQMLIGWVAVERLRREAQPMTVPGIDADIELRETSAGSMPLTCGLFHPAILLPADALEWSPERRRVVLLHELAHVQRRDGVTHLLARLALALYWWHPLVWTAWRGSLRERERAADDIVLNAGARAADYAGHLLAIARSMHSPAAALAMARRSQLEGRLSAILDSARNRQAPRRAAVIASSFAAMAILLPVAAVQASSDTAQDTVQRDIPLSAATPLIEEGKVALSSKNYELATSLFERAQTADPQKTAEATMWLAITQLNQNNPEVAADLYQNALTTAVPESPIAATIMELYAAVLRRLDRLEESAQMADQAAAIRKAQGAQAMSRPSSAHKIGGDVKAPSLTSKVEPKYSEDARLAKYSGAVLLAIEIDVDGIPKNIRIARGLAFGLDVKAVEAVSQWRFKPGTLAGQPVAVSAMVEVNFRLL